MLNVEATALKNDTIISTSEVNVLTELINDSNEAIIQMDGLITSATTAITNANTAAANATTTTHANTVATTLTLKRLLQTKRLHWQIHLQLYQVKNVYEFREDGTSNQIIDFLDYEF